MNDFVTKPLDPSTRSILIDMHGRLKVLESTAETQAAQLLELVGINRDLVRDSQLKSREIHRLIREKQTLLEAIGMIQVRANVPTLEPKWGSRC